MPSGLSTASRAECRALAAALSMYPSDVSSSIPGSPQKTDINEEARIMAVTGPDFVSLQVRDLERSAAFYERYLGLKRSDAGPPHAVVFGTRPIAYADGYQVTLHDRG